MKVHWTLTAENQLRAIHDYIAQNSTVYALRLVDRLTRRSNQIAAFPMSGRRVPEFDNDRIREVFEGSYRLIYHIKADQIDVICLLHSAMEPFNQL
ncbi:MAG: type II toxin-antitoxin system RelE/ParE family toxin [Fibrobacteres bacterium]|nr:type II toxin-antitoxin system RelE/ParE family toxin [Fibrobacterota bacterium]